MTKGNCGGGINGRDHLYTQVLPTNALGKDYILMSFSGQTGGYAYKVIAAKDTTKVYINGVLSTTIMKKGEWIYQHVTSAVAHCVRTDKPEPLILLHCLGGKCIKFNPMSQMVQTILILRPLLGLLRVQRMGI